MKKFTKIVFSEVITFVDGCTSQLQKSPVNRHEQGGGPARGQMDDGYCAARCYDLKPAWKIIVGKGYYK